MLKIPKSPHYIAVVLRSGLYLLGLGLFTFPLKSADWLLPKGPRFMTNLSIARHVLYYCSVRQQLPWYYNLFVIRFSCLVVLANHQPCFLART